MNNYMAHKITKVLSLLAFTSSLGLLEAQSTYTWNPAGPIYTAGRARNMLVDKNDPTGKTLYIGSTSSGIFKTVDGGTQWNPLDDQGSVRNISYLAQDKNNKIWASTGEGFLRFGQKAKAQKGTGLYTLVGTGLTLVQPASVVGEVITRIACDPSNASRVAIASNKGILVSTDGGSSFNSLALPGFTSTTFVSGLDVKFSGDGTLYCSAGSEISYSGNATVYSKVYKADVGLTTLTNITPTNSGLTDANYGRIELAVAPSNNSVIYASCAVKATGNPTTTVLGSGSSAVLKAIFVSYDAGTTWGLVLKGASQNDPLGNGGSIASGDYAHVIVVNPTNPDELFIGGYTLAIFTRKGGSNASPTGVWSRPSQYFFLFIQNYIHENIHDIKIVPTAGGNTRYYCITDAGVYRSSDLTWYDTFYSGSFQPFYTGLVTGQFNSVAIERYPIGANTSSNAASGTSVTPYSGFIGGTGGNGLTYYSGTYSLVTKEESYLSGEIYGAELSRILDGAAFMSTGGGLLLRSTNIKTSDPTTVRINKYSNSISELAPTPINFDNVGFTTGTPFKLWENYGQLAPGTSPDKVYFYNDSVRLPYSILTVATLTSQSTFTFSAGRPPESENALIDSIVVRTGTVGLTTATFAKLPIPFTGTSIKDINIKLTNNYALTGSVTVPPISQIKGPENLMSQASVTLNSVTKTDIISVTFPSPPFATYTTPYYPTTASSASTAVVGDPAAYFRVYATIFYKHKAGDPVKVIDENISTKTASYTGVLDADRRWTRTYTNVNANPNGPKVGVNSVSVVNPATNLPYKIPTSQSARLAVIMNIPDITSNSGTNIAVPNPYAIVVSKSPLNVNDPLNFVRVSQSGCYTDNSSGIATTNTISIPGRPTLLEWSKGGTELYYATDDNKVYRVSHITDIMDLSQSSKSNYKGKFYTDIFTYSAPISSGTLNSVSPYRTTLIGTFPKPISSISVSKDDKTLVVTLTGTVAGAAVMSHTNDARTSDQSNIGWVTKGAATGPLQDVNTYCSIIESSDPNKVLVGTDNGVAYTDNFTSTTPTWKNINDVSATSAKLPNVQVFEMKQQTLGSNDCYNSGQIYIATYGRGIWTTSNFLRPYFVDVKEFDRELTENSLQIFPNPANTQVTVRFAGVDGETATVQVMDISGRMVQSENLGKLGYGEVVKSIELNNLSTGIYMVNVSSSSGQKRVAKLIVTK
jgi:hypothetical protein